MAPTKSKDNDLEPQSRIWIQLWFYNTDPRSYNKNGSTPPADNDPVGLNDKTQQWSINDLDAYIHNTSSDRELMVKPRCELWIRILQGMHW